MSNTALAVGLLLLCTTAQAADFSANAGAGRNGGAAFDLRYETSDRNADGYVTFGIVATGPYQYKGQRVDANGGPYFMATWGDRLRAGVGLVYLLNTSPVHGSNVNAILTLGWYGKKTHAYLLHVSNAGIQRPNFGYDALMVGVRW